MMLLKQSQCRCARGVRSEHSSEPSYSREIHVSDLVTGAGSDMTFSELIGKRE